MNPMAGKAIAAFVDGGRAALPAAVLCQHIVRAGASLTVTITGSVAEYISPSLFESIMGVPTYLDFDPRASSHAASAGYQVSDRKDLSIVMSATRVPAEVLTSAAHRFISHPSLISVPLVIIRMMPGDPEMSTRLMIDTRLQSSPGSRRERTTDTGVGGSMVALPGDIHEAGLNLVDEIRRLLARSGDLAGRNIIVSAGGTREAIDPVRYICNASSGKMGHSLSVAARDRGARVTLVTAASVPPTTGVTEIHVGSAQEMCDAVLQNCRNADALVMAAAPADYRPVSVSPNKIKKSGEMFSLDLVPTPDILAEVARERTANGWPRVVVGFAAETEMLLENAQGKLRRKRLDFIVANDITAPDSGFGVETNRVTLLSSDGAIMELPVMSKREVADVILDRLLTTWQAIDKQSRSDGAAHGS